MGFSFRSETIRCATHGPMNRLKRLGGFFCDACFVRRGSLDVDLSTHVSFPSFNGRVFVYSSHPNFRVLRRCAYKIAEFNEHVLPRAIVARLGKQT